MNNTEAMGLICTFAAIPFALAGFFKYQNMNLESFALAFMRTNFLVPRRLVFSGQNLLIRTLKEMEQEEKKKKRRSRLTSKKKEGRLV